MRAPSARAVVAAIGALLLTVPLTIAIVDNGPDHGPTKPRRTVTITLGGPGHKTVPLPPVAQATATSQAREDAAGAEQHAHSDLHETRLPPAPVVAANDALKPAGQPVIPAHVPLAAQSTPGCRTLLVRNYSGRRGAPILLFVFHFTVSRDTGWAGVLGNVKWFDSPAAQASSNYIVDRRIGACALVVPESQKAWAQAAYNPWALSVEVTANGTEGSYFPAGPGRQKILYLMHRAHQVYKLPYRHGAVNGGRVTRTGFVMHADLGQAGGGHVDVRPYGIDDLIAEAARTDPTRPKPVAATDRVACRKLNWWRRAGRPKGLADSNAVSRRRRLERHGLTCTPRGVARR